MLWVAESSGPCSIREYWVLGGRFAPTLSGRTRYPVRHDYSGLQFENADEFLDFAQTQFSIQSLYVARILDNERCAVFALDAKAHAYLTGNPSTRLPATQQRSETRSVSPFDLIWDLDDGTTSHRSSSGKSLDRVSAFELIWDVALDTTRDQLNSSIDSYNRLWTADDGSSRASDGDSVSPFGLSWEIED